MATLSQMPDFTFKHANQADIPSYNTSAELKDDFDSQAVTLRDWINGTMSTEYAAHKHDDQYYSTASIDATLSLYATAITVSSNYATIATLSNYATVATLTNYATTATLTNYATVATLTNYATVATLTNYATTATLTNYATVATLSNYATVGTLSNYYTKAQITASYYTTATIDAGFATIATLSNYVSSADINSVWAANKLDLIKQDFLTQDTYTSGLVQLYTTAIDCLNTTSGIAAASSANYTYDTTNKLIISSQAAKALTLAGNVAITTGVYVFGGASGAFGGTNSYVRLPVSNDLKFSSTATGWTIEWREYRTAVGANKASIGNLLPSGYAGVQVESDATNNLRLYMSSAFTAWDVTGGSYKNFGTFTASSWNAYAIQREGITLTAWKNGVSVSTWTSSLAIASAANTNSVELLGSSGAGTYLTGCMDSFRVSNIARYTGTSYTVATSAFVPDGNTVLLIQFDGANGATSSIVDDGSPLVVVSNIVTATTTPSTIVMSWDDQSYAGGTLTFYASRDNGTSWTTVSKETVTDISTQPSGKQMRVKTLGVGGTLSRVSAYGWGWK